MSLQAVPLRQFELEVFVAQAVAGQGIVDEADQPGVCNELVGRHIDRNAPDR